jgi:hypothetical protein
MKKFAAQHLWLRSYRRKNPRLLLYWTSKQTAKDRGWKHTILLKDFPQIPEYCPVFPWVKIKILKGRGRGFKNPTAPSVDRIDSSKGYVKGNVRIISWRANMLRNDGTLKEFEALVRDQKRLANN